MIYVLTIRNKDSLVTYKGTPLHKLVFEFVAPDRDVAGAAIRGVLNECRAEDAYKHREFHDALEETHYAESYHSNQSGLQIDWKEVDGVN